MERQPGTVILYLPFKLVGAGSVEKKKNERHPTWGERIHNLQGYQITTPGPWIGYKLLAMEFFGAPQITKALTTAVVCVPKLDYKLLSLKALQMSALAAGQGEIKI